MNPSSDVYIVFDELTIHVVIRMYTAKKQRRASSVTPSGDVLTEKHQRQTVELSLSSCAGSGIRAGLTIVPFMPWHRAPRCQGAPAATC